MTILTKQDIHDYCANLDIRGAQLAVFTFPEGVTKIESMAFEGCAWLTSITIPDSVTEIGILAFDGCTSLTSITIPDSVTEIGDEAFLGCTSLKSIIVPNSVTQIGESAFRGCTALSSITIPDSITEIRNRAFMECRSLTSIKIPEGVTEIGRATFLFCIALESITIPDSVTKICPATFYECTALTQIICNNSDLFTDQNIQNRDQIQLISTAEYFKENYQELLIAIEDSEFKSNHVKSKELNLIIKLHQEDYLPNWKTLATTFNERSMDQIRSILHFFNKTSCMPITENSILLKKMGKEPTTLNTLSMFLNPSEYTYLSMTARDIILRTKEKESDSFCSIQ